MLAAYDRSDPGAERDVIVTGSDFDGTSPTRALLTRDVCVPAARGGSQPDVDSGCGNQVGNAQ